jgi:hypothetical protein
MPDTAQLIAELQEKLGSDHPFILGFVYEIEKEAGIKSFFEGFVKGRGKVAPEMSQLQRGVNRLNAAKSDQMKIRTDSLKPQLTAQRPMPHEFPMDRDTSHFNARMDAKRARGRTEPSMV